MRLCCSEEQVACVAQHIAKQHADRLWPPFLTRDQEGFRSAMRSVVSEKSKWHGGEDLIGPRCFLEPDTI